jgi:glycosyltransferase involved in cell wall biosynthesis
MNDITVSIIIPTYNNADKIIETLDTVFNQTYKFVEVIVIDDGSKDNTEHVVLKYISTHSLENKLKYYKQENAGAPNARNKGMAKSSGQVIKFLDSDDVLYDDDVLGKQVAFMLAGDYDIVYGNEVYYNDNFDEHNFIRKRGNIINVDKPETFWKNVPITSNFLLKRGRYTGLVLWNETLKMGQEFYLLFNYFLRDSKFAYSDFNTVKIRIHDSPDRISNSPTKNRIEYITQLAAFMREDIARLKPNDVKIKAHFNYVITTHRITAYSLNDTASNLKLRSMLFKIPGSTYNLKQFSVIYSSRISLAMGNILNKIAVRLRL